MYSNEDLSSVYTFLKATGEGNLKKMLVDQKMTQTHFNLMMKVLRSCNEAQFIEFAQKEQFPKMKFNSQEVAIREHFWGICFGTLKAAGLLSEMVKQAA